MNQIVLLHRISIASEISPEWDIPLRWDIPPHMKRPLVRKCLNGNVCTNFQDYFRINEYNVRTRNRNILLQSPKVILDFAMNGFFFMSARLYNSLPKEIEETAHDFENKVISYFSSKS